MKLSHSKMALLALASVALLTPAVRGATITPNMGDVILGFRATGNPGQTLNLEVDLGPVSQFYGLAPGQTVPLAGLSTADLVATYGAGWETRADLFWGAIASAGRASGYSNGVVNVPVGTLWATAPNCATAFNRGSSFAQKNASATLEAVFTPGGAGSLYGATSTANSAGAAVISASLAGSWTLQDNKTAGTSFGYFNPTVDNFEGTNLVTSELYELQPGSGAGKFLGNLVVSGSGLSFVAASPTVAIVKSGIVVQSGAGCTGSVTVNDVDNNSTGYCLALALDQTGPFNIGTTNVTLTVTDGAGYSTSAVATVTIAAAAPTVASASNISTNLASGAGCSATVTYNAPAGSGCATPVNVVCTPASGASFNSGITTVTCIATDAASKTGTNSFTVTVTSVAAPTLSSHADVTNNPATCSSAVVSYSLPTASGCNTPGTVVCTPASGSTFNLGTTAVSCSVTDAAARTATSGFNVVVVSTAAPTLSSHAAVTNSAAAGQCSAAVTYSLPTASGCNTPGTVVCSPASGSTFNVGTTAVSCSVTDAALRVGSGSFNVVVTSAGPAVATPSSIVTNVPVGTSSIVLTYATPTATGCATPINVVCSPASGSTFSVGSTNVTCTGTDALSRTGTSSFTVTVNGAGISGITQIVNGLTDPKLTTSRKASLLASLNLANADLNSTNAHIKASTKTLQACGQLTGFLIKVKTYGQLKIISSNEVVALTAAANAQKVALGCK